MRIAIDIQDENKLSTVDFQTVQNNTNIRFMLSGSVIYLQSLTSDEMIAIGEKFLAAAKRQKEVEQKAEAMALKRPNRVQ